MPQPSPIARIASCDARGADPRPDPDLPRWAGCALDLVSLAVLCACLLILWPRTATPVTMLNAAPTAQPPVWGGFLDLLLEGPDAGEWARNAALVAAGKFQHVDHHRMPTWLLLTGGLNRGGWWGAGLDLVTAGHVVNRSLYVALGLCTWVGGRLLMGPGTAALAACLVLGSPHLRLASERYGIDIGVGAAVAALTAAALVAARWPRAAILAGPIVCAAVLMHYTTLPLWLPALALCAVVAPRRQRLRATGGLALGLGLTGLVATLTLHLPTPDQWLAAMVDGLPGQTASLDGVLDGAPHALSTLSQRVLPQLLRGLSEGPAELLQSARPPDSPWALVVLAGCLGVTGLALPRLLRPAKGQRRRDAWRALLPGLCLAAMATSVPLLAAVHAPPRYIHNLAALCALLLASGGAALVLGGVALLPLGATVRLPIRRVAEALVGCGLALTLVPRLDLPTRPAGDVAVGLFVTGQAVREVLPANVPIACPATEIAVATGHPACTWPLCSAEDPGGDPAACFARIQHSCAANQDLAWISLPDWQLSGAQNTELRALDQWIGARQAPLRRIQVGQFRATLRLLPAGWPAPEIPK